MRFTTGHEEAAWAIGAESRITGSRRKRDRRPLRRTVLLTLALLTATAGLACRVVPMDHPRVMLTPTRDPQAVRQALEKALRNRGWTFVEESPGSILATINVRTHEVVSRITYTGSSLEFAYVSSQDMMYQVSPGGIEKIHRNYNGWIANVIRDTEAYLEGRRPEGGLDQ